MIDILGGVLQSIINGAVFTAVSLILGYFSLKVMIRRAMKEKSSDEQKRKFGLWLQEIIRDSLSEWLADKRVKKLVIDILDLIKDKLKE